MIDSTNAFKKLKEQIQESIDFVILCCHAVPALKGYIKAVDKGSAQKIPDPDYFGGSVQHKRLKAISPSYRKILGKFLILSSFSYFEAFVKDVMKEIFEFHSDANLLDLAIEKRDKTIALVSINASTENNVRKLRERMIPSKVEKYVKINTELKSNGYRFPSDHFSAYGILRLWEQIEEMRAVQIPKIIQEALGLSWTDDEITNFHRIRDLRNNIAHGVLKEVDLSAAIDDNRFLRNLAIKVDKHIVKHFFIIET